MQNKIVNLVNEAVNINTGLLTKSVSQSVEAGQTFVQQVSDQAAEALNIKSFDDYVASQKNWNAFVVEQTQKSTQSAFELGNEAFDAYIGLWKKAFAPVAQVIEPKVVKAKAA